MAIKKTIEIEIKDNLQPFEKEVKKTTTTIEDLNKAFKEVEKSSTDVNATFEQIYGELQPLTTRLGEAEDRLYELALAGKQNTKEYRDLLEATANYRKVQIQTDLVVDSAAQTMSQKLGGALQGAASGFSLVQGAMGLLGTQSQEVEEALLKVQSAMALAEGIEGVRAAIPLFKTLGSTIQNAVVGAFSTLRGAMIASGVGLLVVGVGLLVEKMMSLSKANNTTAKSYENLNNLMDQQNTILERNKNNLKTSTDFQVAYAEAVGASEEKILSIQKKGIAEREKQRQNELSIVENQLKSLRNKQISAYVDEDYDRYKEIQKQIQDKQKLKSDLINEEFDLKRQLKLLDANYKHEKALEQREELKAEKQRLDELSKLQNEALQNRKREENEIQAEIEKATEDNFNRTLTQQQVEIKAVEDKYFILLERAKQYNLDTIELEKAKDAELQAIKDKSLEDEGAKMRAFYEKMMEDNRKKREADKILQEQKIQGVKDGFTTIGNLAQLFAGKNEEQQKRAFKVQKAANIANTLIDTYSSATKSYNSLAGVPYVGPILGFAAAAAAVAAGLVNVKNISQQQFESASASGGGGSTPSAPNVSATQPAPSFNIVGNGNIGQLASLNQAPVQAYVVSGEVTSQQALDRNRLRNATF